MTVGIVKSFESVLLERPLDAFMLCCITFIYLFLIAMMFLISLVYFTLIELDKINAQQRTLNKEITNEIMTVGIVK